MEGSAMPRQPTGFPRGRPKGSGALGEHTRVTVRVPELLYSNLRFEFPDRELADLAREALAHYRVCPHRHETRAPVRLSNAELRAARDPFQALRAEFRRYYEQELRAELNALKTLLHASRANYAPTLLARAASAVDKSLGAILTLLAAANAPEPTLERWPAADAD
jgi:hypothetical protein